MICAVCDKETNIVINRVVANSLDVAPDNAYLIEIPDGVMCDMGWLWDGSNFINPNPPETEII